MFCVKMFTPLQCELSLEKNHLHVRAYQTQIKAKTRVAFIRQKCLVRTIIRILFVNSNSKFIFEKSVPQLQ